jgi:hypothetical protein
MGAATRRECISLFSKLRWTALPNLCLPGLRPVNDALAAEAQKEGRLDNPLACFRRSLSSAGVLAAQAPKREPTRKRRTKRVSTLVGQEEGGPLR